MWGDAGNEITEKVDVMEFILGCNYWASNAGADMWRAFDLKSIDKDIRTLSSYGIKQIRVFPNWRDFQPVEPLFSSHGVLDHYTIQGQVMPDNPYYLDQQMMDRFSAFLDICDKYGLKVIVGLLTGWMSGALFVPSALYGENFISSPVAQYFEQLFIKGFIERFRERECIIAWDLGNECNNNATVKNRWEVANWIATIANAIRAADPGRQIISGMHDQLVADGNWLISDQALYLDVLTTHPYPFWGQYTHVDETMSVRGTMYPTAQTRLYGDIGNRPCIAEETGTMGPMICSDENAAGFLRVNMFSLWANGSKGIMWWCAHDQTRLESFPYSDQMVERELGMLYHDHTPKPVLKQMHTFSQWLDNLDFELPAATIDAVCLLTRHQEHWGVGYMTYILSKLAGLNCRFAYADDPLPEASLYIMPSINGIQVLPKNRYDELKKRVAAGADLYISLDNAVLSEFEALSGLHVLDSYVYTEKVTACVDGKVVECVRKKNTISEPTTAKVLAYDDQNRPFITENRYGKGRVLFANAPIEADLIEKRNAFHTNAPHVYRTLFADRLADRPVSVTNNELFTTYHPVEDGMYVVVVNHNSVEKKFSVNLREGYCMDKVYYGSMEEIAPYDACVFKVIKK